MRDLLASAVRPIRRLLPRYAPWLASAVPQPAKAIAAVNSLLKPRREVDLVISPNEISFAHGTGVLMARLLEGRPDLLHMRSRTNYGGSNRIDAVEHLVLPDLMEDRREIFSIVGSWLADYKVRSIICVPYFETDLTLAVAAQAITGAPMGIWVMDDNCLENTGIQRPLMAEAIDRASALFAISPELKLRYQDEFGKSMAVLPPLVAPALLRTEPSPPPAGRSLVIIGNVWSVELLELTVRTIEKAGLAVTWFASNPGQWLGALTIPELARRGVTVVEGDAPDKVRDAVLGAVAVIVPSDSGAAGEHAAALGAMSLPTRMPFTLATTGTPMIVLGRVGTAAARFVERFGVGSVVPYDAAELKKAVDRLSDAKVQSELRARAASVAQRFSFAGAGDFVMKAIADNGRWPDDRFESLFPGDVKSFSYFCDKPAPAQYAKHFGEVVSLCDRLKAIGFTPDWILDIGASTAIWSHAVSSVYTDVRFVLCDPLFSRYPKVWTKPNFELVEAAIGEKRGEATFSVSSDLYGSSLITVSEIVAVTDRITVPIRTVDEIAAEKKLAGRGLLKIDVQFAEHLVVEGALETLRSGVDVVILELTLPRVHPSAKTLLEMMVRMDELGFRPFDHVGGWRLPSTGELEQLDMVFVRKGLRGTIQSAA
ncbi:MAG: FkbM family methyltransferase [Hyphomicrobiaceae bacterium]